MELPGTNSVYLSQSLKFLAPVRPGDTVHARAEVTDLDAKRRRVKLRTTCTNQRGEMIADGEAVMLVDDVHAVPANVTVTTGGVTDVEFQFTGEATASYTITATSANRTRTVTVPQVTGQAFVQ